MARSTQKPIYTSLYFQVLVGIALGIIVGFVSPERAAAMKPLGDGFIKLVKMLIAPIVFTTVVVGIAHMGAMKDVGRIDLRTLIYFEVRRILDGETLPGPSGAADAVQPRVSLATE